VLIEGDGHGKSFLAEHVPPSPIGRKGPLVVTDPRPSGVLMPGTSSDRAGSYTAPSRTMPAVFEQAHRDPVPDEIANRTGVAEAAAAGARAGKVTRSAIRDPGRRAKLVAHHAD